MTEVEVRTILDNITKLKEELIELEDSLCIIGSIGDKCYNIRHERDRNCLGYFSSFEVKVGNPFVTSCYDNYEGDVESVFATYIDHGEFTTENTVSFPLSYLWEEDWKKIEQERINKINNDKYSKIRAKTKVKELEELRRLKEKYES